MVAGNGDCMGMQVQARWLRAQGGKEERAVGNAVLVVAKERRHQLLGTVHPELVLATTATLHSNHGRIQTTRSKHAILGARLHCPFGGASSTH